MENAIVKILSRIDTNNLPVLPKVLVDLLDAIQRQDIDIDSLGQIIEQDASISANILSAANSPYYRQWGEVSELKKLIQIMGLDAVKSLVMTRAIQQFFARIPTGQQSHLEVIWFQSLTCAHLARNLAQLVAYDFPDEVYLAGLIHRLGQLLLMQCFPVEYPDFLAAHPDGNIAAEKAQFGAAHHEVGAYVIAGWNLRSYIADAVLFQHQSIETILDNVNIVKIVNLACKLSNINAENKYSVFGQANRLFGLNQSLVASMLEDVGLLVEETANNLGVNISRAMHNRLSNLTTPEQRVAVQNQLGEHVKNIAFTAAIQSPLHAVAGYEKLATILRRDMSVLFGFPASLLFVHQPELDTLESIVEEQAENTCKSNCSVNLNNESSLLAKAWHTRKVLHSFNLDKTNPNALHDRKIYQKLKTEDMIVFPLIQGEKVLGVIVAGLKRTDVKRVKLNMAFINLFIEEVAKILQALLGQEASAEQPENFTSIQTHYASYARKLGHEINNPLSIINNYLYLLSLKLGSEHTDQIKAIQAEIERVSNITLSLSDFSLASAKTTNNIVDLNTLIIDLLKLFEVGRIFSSHNITTRLNLDNKLNNISTHKDKLKQILTNLIKNAAEAMPTGGEIIISTKAYKAIGGKQSVEIQIQDNGPGLPEAVLQNLFKPIDNTKDKQHAGLGLTICKNLVDELKGEIRCQSSPKHGTTFNIILPNNT